jgi:hypothetical protein
MGKEKKTLGIKTSRYFTKTCTNCGFEYPNWFTNCPKCNMAWDEAEAKKSEEYGDLSKKTIKIVVKITEEDFDKAISKVNLIFSADRGKSWYQMEMDIKMDYYIAEVAEVPIGSVIIYYIEVYLEDGERIIENNNGKYFYYKVGTLIEEAKENIKQSTTKPQDYNNPKEIHRQNEDFTYSTLIQKSAKINQEPINIPSEDSQSSYKATIFGKPQTQIDPNLKICPYCNSKIKKMWSACPICGKLL